MKGQQLADGDESIRKSRKDSRIFQFRENIHLKKIIVLSYSFLFFSDYLFIYFIYLDAEKNKKNWETL